MRLVLLLLTLMTVLLVLARGPHRIFARTLDDAVAEIRDRASARLRAAGVQGPFAELALVADKGGRILDVRGRRDGDDRFDSLKRYPVLGASGHAGPKLREGDHQVPEGVYRVLSLNPNSRFHQSLELDYPNAFDRARAAEEGRDEPGSAIFIHGGAESVGCLALGDPAIEEVFLLVADTGAENVTVVLCPSAPARPFERADAKELPPWIDGVDAALADELERVRVR